MKSHHDQKTPSFPRKKHHSAFFRKGTRILPLLGCLAVFGGCAGSFFGKVPRDFIEVVSITQVPESDPFTLRDARIDNDSLKFTASYGGGCREHVFTLYAARAEDAENTAVLYIQHNANNDLCRAVINADSVAFSLKGLKSALNLRARATLTFSPAMTAVDSGVKLTY